MPRSGVSREESLGCGLDLEVDRQGSVRVAEESVKVKDPSSSPPDREVRVMGRQGRSVPFTFERRLLVGLNVLPRDSKDTGVRELTFHR